MDSSQITDLRTTLDFLAERPGQLVSTDVEVDPYLEIAGIYRQGRLGHSHRSSHPDRPRHDVQQGQGLRHAGGGRDPGQPRTDRPPTRQRTQAPGLRPARRARQRRPPGGRARRPGALPGSGHQAAVRSAHRHPAHPEHAQGRGARSSTWACCAARTPRREYRTSPSTACACRGPTRISVSFSIGPPHRRLPGEGLGHGQAAAGLLQHRPRPGHLRGHLVRGAHHSARLRRAHHRRRPAQPSGGTGAVRHPERQGDRPGGDRARRRVPAERPGRRGRHHRPGLGHARVPRLRRPRPDPVTSPCSP